MSTHHARWMAAIYCASIPFNVLGIACYLHWILRKRTPVGWPGPAQDVILTAMLFTNLSITAVRLVMPTIDVANGHDPADIAQRFMRFAKLYSIALTMEDVLESLTRMSFAIGLLLVARAIPKGWRRTLLQSLPWTSFVFAFRVLPSWFICQPLNLLWTTGFLRGEQITGTCYNLATFLYVEQAVDLATDIFVLSVIALAIASLPARSRRSLRSGILLLAALSALSQILLFFAIHYLVLSHRNGPLSPAMAEGKMLGFYLWKCFRAGFYTAFPLLMTILGRFVAKFPQVGSDRGETELSGTTLQTSSIGSRLSFFGRSRKRRGTLRQTDFTISEETWAQWITPEPNVVSSSQEKSKVQVNVQVTSVEPHPPNFELQEDLEAARPSSLYTDQSHPWQESLHLGRLEPSPADVQQTRPVDIPKPSSPHPFNLNPRSNIPLQVSQISRTVLGPPEESVHFEVDAIYVRLTSSWQKIRQNCAQEEQPVSGIDRSIYNEVSSCYAGSIRSMTSITVHEAEEDFLDAPEVPKESPTLVDVRDSTMSGGSITYPVTSKYLEHPVAGREQDISALRMGEYDSPTIPDDHFVNTNGVKQHRH